MCRHGGELQLRAEGGGEEEARRRRRQWRELLATVESLRRELGAPIVVAGDWRPGGGDTYAPSTLDHILVAGAADRVRALGMCERQRCEPRGAGEMADDYRRVSDHCPVVADLPR